MVDVETCAATKPGPYVPLRCKLRTWRGTDYCYQHAIANRQALVVTEPMLVGLFPDEPMLGHRLWRRLKEAQG